MEKYRIFFRDNPIIEQTVWKLNITADNWTFGGFIEHRGDILNKGKKNNYDGNDKNQVMEKMVGHLKMMEIYEKRIRKHRKSFDWLDKRYEKLSAGDEEWVRNWNGKYTSPTYVVKLLIVIPKQMLSSVYLWWPLKICLEKSVKGR